MLKIGVVGTGLIAREHAKAISLLPGRAMLAAATDVATERLREFCDAFQVARRHESVAALVADPGVDLVAVTTPPSAHETAVVAALDGGKHVFCEKPLAHSMASALRIAAAEARHPGRLSVSYQLRYEASFRRLLWLCRNGWLGEIESALIERHGYIPHCDPGKTGWWGKWDVAGGGVLITQLIHELDILGLALGFPASVSAKIDTRFTAIESEDCAEAEILFAGGACARCVATVNSGSSGGSFSIRGSRGSVSLPWRLALKEPGRAEEALQALDRALPDTRAPSTAIASRGLRFLRRHLGIAPAPALTPHALMYLDIAASIEGGKPLPVPSAQALDSLQLCMAAYESAIAGREIALPLSSASTVYAGVTKEGYDARKCSRQEGEQRQSKPDARKMNSYSVRVGLIGLDTSHAPAFTRVLHDPEDPFHIPGARVVAAYPGGSPDMNISISRVGGFTSELKDRFGVAILDSPEKVADACDVVFILSSDGRMHPAQFRAVAGRGKPVFVDKPFAISVADAEAIFSLAAKTGTKVFASSAFRYADGLVAALESIRAAGERVKTCRVRCWLPIEETQGRYFWYGIHAAEMLLACMGKGVRAVEATGDAGKDVISVWHDDGRESCIEGSRSDGSFHVHIETDKRKVDVDLASSALSISARVLRAALDVLTEGRYPRLWGASATGSVSGDRPGRILDPARDETLDVVRLLDAAQRSHASKQKVTV